MNRSDEAKALYLSWSKAMDESPHRPWEALSKDEQWAWRKALDMVRQPVALIGAALRYRLGTMALEALRRGQWLRPWVLLRMALLVPEKDDIPF